MSWLFLGRQVEFNVDFGMINWFFRGEIKIILQFVFPYTSINIHWFINLFFCHDLLIHVIWLSLGLPSVKSPFNLFQGPPNRNFTCATCHGNFTECPGHFGWLKLTLPVFNVGYFNSILNILKCICKVIVFLCKLSILIENSML